MATIATRLSNTGTLLVNGGFDENTSIAPSKFRTTSNTVFASALDEVSLAAGAVSFNGTNQYLTVPDNNTLNMGTSDFTLEGWIYLTSVPTGSYYPNNTTPYEGAFILNKDGLNAVTWPQYAMFVDVNMKVCASFIAVPNGLAGGPTALVTGSTTISLNTWYHVAFTRVGVNGTLWLNGVSNGTTSSIPSNLTNGARVLYVAYEDRSPLFQTKNLFPGYISNLRIVKGTALYTTNFTPPASILPAIANTSLLLNVTDSTNFIKDNGPNKFTVTNANTATFNTNGPFNQGSTTVKQRQVTDGTLEVYSNFDEVNMILQNADLYFSPATSLADVANGVTVGGLANLGISGAIYNASSSEGPAVATQNGVKVLQFNSSSYKQLTMATEINLSTNSSVFFVGYQTSNRLIALGGSASSSNGNAFLGWGGANNTGFLFRNSTDGGQTLTGLVSVSGLKAFGMIQGTSTFTYYDNGTTPISGTYVSGTYIFKKLGARDYSGTTNGQLSTGYLGDVVAFNRVVSNDEAVLIMKLLKERYNIQ
jgi:hypothetical protein